MKTKTTLLTRIIPAELNDHACCCGATRSGPCKSCGYVPTDSEITYETGTVWERVETKHGSATFSYDLEDPGQRETRLLGALRRIVGYTVQTGFGHYGKFQKTGELSAHGTYTSKRI